MKNKERFKRIIVELTHHLPYSMFGVLVSVLLMGILTFFAKVVDAESQLPAASQELFHLFHSTHIFLSALVTTAMFWKHDEGSVGKAAVIGLMGSLGICGISDIIMPFIGGTLLGQKMHFHICLIEEPGLILPFSFLGILGGFLAAKTFEKVTQFSHSMHVFFSSTASLLYLISFGIVDWIHILPGVFFVTLIAVVLPCCMSDVVFPLLCTHRFCNHEKSKSC